jgi:hypothetical protein
VAQRNPIHQGLATARIPKSACELQEENARLKDLVVTLSSLVLKNVAHEFRSGIHAFSSRAHADPRSQAEENELAEALEAAGHELMTKAVEMKSVLKRERRK